MQQRIAKDALNAHTLEDPLEREITYLLLANRTMLDDALYVQVTIDGEQVVASAEEGWADFLHVHPDEESFVHEIKKDGKRAFDFYGPLPPGNNGPSYVRFGLSLAQVDDQVDAILVNMAWIAVAFCMVGLLIGMWLYRGVFGPLNKLLHSVKELAAGDHRTRANVQTGDELEALANEFNRMADAIASRTADLKRANIRLAKADQAKSDFLATMGHEWKTPLHALRGYAQLLLEEVDGPLNAKQREDIEAMLAAGNHLLDLIENILHFIQSNYDEGPNHIESLNIASLARQAWDHVRPAARARCIAFIDELPENILIQGDRTRLRQVFINLLGNAVQYTDSGTVTMRAGQIDERVQISIIDTGIGIDPDLTHTIFEPFQRVGRRLSKPSEGLGLGLTVAKRYVTAHAGQIDVTSKPGIGSDFTITLPIYVTPQPNCSDERGA